MDVFVDVVIEEDNKKDECEVVIIDVNVEGVVIEDFNLGMDFFDIFIFVSKDVEIEYVVSGEIEGESNEFDLGLCEEMNKEMGSYKVQMSIEIDSVRVKETDIFVSVFKFEEALIGRLDVNIQSFVSDIETSFGERIVNCKIEIFIEFNKLDEVKLSGKEVIVGNDILQEVCFILEKVEKLLQCLLV